MLLKFSYRKTVQALNYLASRAGGQINKMKALKLLFFADRYHLRKYGRSITNDQYFAMDYGPVASKAKNFAEANMGWVTPEEFGYSTKFLQPVSHANIELRSIGEIEVKAFSKSDLEALQFSWDRFSSISEFELSKITHFYPEWKKYEMMLNAGYGKSYAMNYEDFLEDPPKGYDSCYDLTPEERELRRDELSDLNRFCRALG